MGEPSIFTNVEKWQYSCDPWNLVFWLKMPKSDSLILQFDMKKVLDNVNGIGNLNY